MDINFCKKNRQKDKLLTFVVKKGDFYGYKLFIACFTIINFYICNGYES